MERGEQAGTGQSLGDGMGEVLDSQGRGGRHRTGTRQSLGDGQGEVLE